MQAFISAIEPASRVAVAILFDTLWEAAVVACLVWLILRAIPQLNATTRYSAWSVGLIAGMLLPLATAIPQVSVLQPATPQTATQLTSTTHHPASVAAPPSAVTQPRTNDGSPMRLPERLRVRIPHSVGLGFFAAWALIALLLLLRLGWNLFRLERLKRDALPLDVDYRDSLARWRSAQPGGRDIRLCVCDDVEVPVAVGLFDSMILVPRNLIDTLASEEIDQIVLHELGHLRRADDWTNGLQRVVQALLFFNPAIQFICAQLDLEREVACDDWVVDQTHSVRPYASCLTKMAEMTAWPHHPLQAPGVFVTRRGLSLRIERLLRSGRSIGTDIALAPAGAVAAVLIAAFFLLQTIAPSFAFTQAQQPTQIAVTAPIAPQAVHAAAPVNRSVAPKTIVHDRVITRYRDVFVPAVHVHQAARTVRTPSIQVDLPASHFRVPINEPTASAQAAIVSARAAAASARAFAAPAIARALAVTSGLNGPGNCIGCGFRGQNLSGRSFRGQNLTGTAFAGAILRNVDFSNAVLNGVDFSHADLRGASFTHAEMNGCNLSHAMLSGATFDGAQMHGCDFDPRSLSSTQARSVLFACGSGCDFSGVNLSGQDLHAVKLTGVDLSRSDLRSTDFSGSALSGVDFDHARMDGARFNGASLIGCSFVGVNVRNVDFTGAKMSGDTLNDDTIMR